MTAPCSTLQGPCPLADTKGTLTDDAVQVSIAMVGSPVRRLILLRHAKSAWPDVADHKRPLAPPRSPGCSHHRTLAAQVRLRARETWLLAEEKLGAHFQTIFESRAYRATSTEFLDLARQTPSEPGPC
jgi:phosphohistidine phosphatase